MIHVHLPVREVVSPTTFELKKKDKKKSKNRLWTEISAKLQTKANIIWKSSGITEDSDIQDY